MGIPGFWGGTKRENITSGERFFLSVACLYWYVHLNVHLGNWALPGHGETHQKLHPKMKNKTRNTPAPEANSPMETIPSQRMGTCCHLVFVKPKSALVKSRGFSDGAETFNAKF